MKILAAIVRQIYSGGANKAVIAAAGALVNAAVSGHWGSTQAIIGYVVPVLVFLLPNVQKAVDSTITVNEPPVSK